MSDTDQRRVRVQAPAEGSTARPPARRHPRVVTPEDRTVAAGSSTPSAAPAAVVIPAPGAGSPAAPPPDTRQPPGPLAAPQAEVREADEMPHADTKPPGTGARETGWRRFVPSKRAVGIAALVVLVILGGIAWWSYAKFRSIDRVDLSGVLASGNGTNYLIVGSDTREGVSADDPNAAAILGDNTAGGPERSDTILILRIDSEGTHTLSVPRDLFVTIADTGQQTRINAAFNGGPQRLIKTLDEQLDLPIHHYLEIDFVSFADLVDALGGITIEFPHPAFDTHSGLNVPEAGPQKLDGTQALAYVRSRFYTEVIDGREVREGTGDIGRVVRQQQFLTAVGSAVQSTKNPFTLAKVADSMAGGMRIDSDLGYFAAIKLFLKMRGINPEPNSLPTTGFRTSAGAAVLRLVQPDADEILARFGSEGSRTG